MPKKAHRKYPKYHRGGNIALFSYPIPKKQLGGTSNEEEGLGSESIGQLSGNQAFGTIAALYGIGQGIGRPLKTKAEQIDQSGNLVNRDKAQYSAIAGGIADPLAALSARGKYKGGYTDITGEGYLDYLEAEAKKGGTPAEHNQAEYERNLLYQPVYRHGGDPRYANYHLLSRPEYDKIVNVERNELEVKGGKVIKDFKGKPPHPKDENEIDFFGNIIAKPGNIIVPKDKRKEYLEGDRITRNTIEAQLRRDQIKRNNEELEVYRGGGKVSEKISLLMKENYPHKQAVAIALDMNRRGKLEHGGDAGIPELMRKLEVGTIPTQEYLKTPLKAKADKYFGITVNIDGEQVPISKYKRENKLTDKELFEKISGLENSMKKSKAYLAKYDIMQKGGEEEFLTLEDYRNLYKEPADRSGLPLAPTPLLKEKPYTDTELIPFDYDEPKTPRTRSGGNYVQYLPALYNLGLGLFGDTPTEQPIFNPYQKRIERLLGERQIQYDPLFRDIELETAGAERGIRGTSRGNAGLYANARIALANAAQRAKSRARLEADIANAAFRREEASGLDILGQQDVAARDRARALTTAYETNRAQFIPKGLEQISGISQGRSRDAILIDALRNARARGASDDEMTRLQELLG